MPAIVCTTCGKHFQAPPQGLACCPRCFTPVGSPDDASHAPQEDAWYYQVMGQEVGPIPFTTLQQLVHDGKVSPETLVRRAEGARWLLAERVSGLVPPAEGRAEWYFTHEGKKLGPVSYPMLRKLIVAGQLFAEDLLWQRGWPNAVTVGKCIADNLLALPDSEIPSLQKAGEIPFTCPHCGDHYGVDRSLAGKKLLCRSCNTPAQIDS